jgi:hypothetical protein
MACGRANDCNNGDCDTGTPDVALEPRGSIDDVRNGVIRYRNAMSELCPFFP